MLPTTYNEGCPAPLEDQRGLDCRRLPIKSSRSVRPQPGPDHPLCHLSHSGSTVLLSGESRSRGRSCFFLLASIFASPTSAHAERCNDSGPRSRTPAAINRAAGAPKPLANVQLKSAWPSLPQAPPRWLLFWRPLAPRRWTSRPWAPLTSECKGRGEGGGV